MNNGTLHLLFAEDDDEDWILIEDSFEGCKLKNSIERVRDGEELKTRLSNGKPPPDIILLDIKMPKVNGREVLRWIRANPRINHLPVIMLTSSKLEADIMESYKDGANSYLIKPITFESMKTALSAIRHYWGDLMERPPARPLGP